MENKTYFKTRKKIIGKYFKKQPFKREIVLSAMNFQITFTISDGLNCSILEIESKDQFLTKYFLENLEEIQRRIENSLVKKKIYCTKVEYDYFLNYLKNKTKKIFQNFIEPKFFSNEISFERPQILRNLLIDGVYNLNISLNPIFSSFQINDSDFFCVFFDENKIFYDDFSYNFCSMPKIKEHFKTLKKIIANGNKSFEIHEINDQKNQISFTFFAYVLTVIFLIINNFPLIVITSLKKRDYQLLINICI